MFHDSLRMDNIRRVIEYVGEADCRVNNAHLLISEMKIMTNEMCYFSEKKEKRRKKTSVDMQSSLLSFIESKVQNKVVVSTNTSL